MSIVTTSDVQTVLMAASLTDTQSALLNLIHPLVEAAIRDHLQYNPEQATHAGELYPRISEAAIGDDGAGIWNVNDESAYLSGNGGAASDVLVLRHIPVRSISSLRVDYNAKAGTASGAFAASTELTEGTDFYPDYDQAGVCRSGIIYRVGASWPSEPGTIKVTYVGGYSAAELAGTDADINASAIKIATLMECVRTFKTFLLQGKQGRAGFAGGPLSSESLGAYSYSTDASLVAMLAGFKVSLSPEAVARLEPFVHMGMMLL